MDKHLNLFFSYNHDNELIENNLTRAWIVTLRMLSSSTRNRLLRSLLRAHLWRLSTGRRPDELNFSHVELALQGKMDKHRSRKCVNRYILAIASVHNDVMLDGIARSDSFAGAEHKSIPDAWLIDRSNQYCFLIESKVGFNPINEKQIRRHGSDWLGITTVNELRRSVVALTWLDIVESLNAATGIASEQDSNLMFQLIEYLSFFGYRTFQGFKFQSFLPPPNVKLGLPAPVPRLKFNRLDLPPSFKIHSA
jgi:hypothetical protein